MRVIAPIPKQFEDSNGVPYANGKVTVYLHNSTSLAQIYQEAEGGTLAPNPTILDSHGAWNAFVNGSTAYDYVIQDEHDNVIFSYSNVSATGLGTASESIYELAMFDLSQAGNGLYNDIDADLGKGMLPIISAGSQGVVRYYYYTSRDSQAHTMTFTCGYDGRVELLILHSNNTYEFSSVGGVSVPLVGVEIKSSGAAKRFGDDGFVKNNPSDGKPSLYLPELGWWLFNVRLFLRNVTARDLVQQITLEWDWNAFFAEGVPPATYTAQYPPSMQTDVDFTTTFTRQYGASALIHKDLYPDNWLTVRPVVYGGTPLTDTEWAVVIDIFKVRDA